MRVTHCCGDCSVFDECIATCFSDTWTWIELAVLLTILMFTCFHYIVTRVPPLVSWGSAPSLGH